MACELLFKGFDTTCELQVGKYYQEAVLINKADVKDYLIVENNDKIGISFDLGSGLTGYRFKLPAVGNTILGSFSKSKERGLPVYEHSVTIAVTGVGHSAKTTAKMLDLSRFFVALQAFDGTVEIFGWEYGMETDSYDYELNSTINLRSIAGEYSPPFIYTTTSASPQVDFDNLFSSNPEPLTGDFNDDFNNDFLIS
jgi:hypothetical protein